MENLVSFNSLFGGVYFNKKVLVTGHTGFKGSWLAMWLQMMGADVYGYALSPPSEPNHFNLLNLKINSRIGDIRDYNSLKSFIDEARPEIVFHLAAQALVRESYDNPVETYSTNVMGTLNVLEACRKSDSVKAIVNVTSDKCYENKEWIWGYRENDPMGGYDPYSSSKGCAELLTSSYRNSYLNIKNYGSEHQILIATARAGNVIGGGDWADDRLIPDVVKAAALSKHVLIRNPNATRPWQHVLEPLSGYLTLGSKLLEGKKEFAEAWNFGPDLFSNITVDEVVSMASKLWGAIKVDYSTKAEDAHEAHLLMLDCSKSVKLLKWMPVWNIGLTLSFTINWYREFYFNRQLATTENIIEYVNNAVSNNIVWTKQQ